MNVGEGNSEKYMW